MYLLGYASLTFKLQEIIGKEILLPEFTSCCCLFERAQELAFFRTQNDIVIFPKTTGITFPISRKVDLKNTSGFHHILIRKSLAIMCLLNKYAPKRSVGCPKYSKEITNHMVL